jgi:hypothetical protein
MVLATLEIARGRPAQAIAACERVRDSTRFLSAFMPELPVSHLFPAVEARLLLAADELARGDAAAAARLAVEAERIGREEHAPRSTLRAPFLAARVALLQGDPEPLGLALAIGDHGEWTASVARSAFGDLLACADLLVTVDPILAARCLAAADASIDRLAEIHPGDPSLAEIQASRLLGRGQPDEAIRRLESAASSPEGRFDPRRLVAHGTLLAAARERLARKNR